ncbi:hypothetical protein [Pseudomonas fulva]|uniref:hypothetical protein n=1 Tax=Pseudomonas fulva TaxID=47880 RepID=UPI00067256FA|nr:hypothetical protein [Pseudomonas fulva]
MAKKKPLSLGPSWNENFVVLGEILFWGFWAPVLFLIAAPWLSLAIVSYWPKPVLAGFLSAMASTGWLVASVVILAVIAYQAGMGYYRQHRSRKRTAAELAAKRAQGDKRL